MNKLKVLILEPEKDQYNLLCLHYNKDFFLKANFDAQFSRASSEDEVKNKLNNTIVDVFISDMYLSTPDSIGLIVVQSVKINYPNVFCIGNSGKDISYRDVAAKLPTFDMFIDKTNLIEVRTDYLEDMIKEFLNKFKNNTNLTIDEKSELPNELKNNTPELNSLLSQVTFTCYKQDPDVEFKKIVLTKISGGISGSYVFNMTATTIKGNISTIPAVLKISKRKNAEEELENYNRFVKWILPYTWRADLLGFGFTNSYGALCHSFIMSGKENIDSLTHFLSNGKVGAVKEVINRIFDPNNKKWYADEIIREETNIIERYSKRYFRSINSKNKSNEKFKEYCHQIFPGTTISKTNISVFGQQYALPLDYLFVKPHNKYQTCIIHGDMNSNNVIVAHNKEIIFIDFQYTGRGHVFEDFISMEASVRLYFGTKLKRREPKGEKWKEIILMDKNINIDSIKENKSQMYQLIALIRSLAKENFPNENFQNYYYGVATIFFMMLRLPGLSERQVGYLLSGILTSLEKI